MTPMTLTSLSSERIISDCSYDFSLVASMVSLEMYESRPTAVSLAAHSPDMMKLPDSSLSPSRLVISSDSPVRSASLT